MDSTNSETPVGAGVCQCAGNCVDCFKDITTATTNLQTPRISEIEEHTLRDLRDRWESFGSFTGDRRVLAIVEGLTLVLIESGRLP